MNVFELITKINNFPVFHTNIFHFRIIRQIKRRKYVKIYFSDQAAKSIWILKHLIDDFDPNGYNG